MIHGKPKAKTPHYQRKMAKPLFIAAVIVTLISGAILGWSYIQNQKIGADTVAWQHRAQVAANPQHMEKYLRNCELGMEKWQITTGYDAILFKRPDNDMTLVMQALNSTVTRAQDLQKENMSSIAYATNIEDLRGIIREMDLHAGSWWILHALPLYFARIFFLLLTIILWIYWLYDFDRKEPEEIKEEEEARRLKEEEEERKKAAEDAAFDEKWKKRRQIRD